MNKFNDYVQDSKKILLITSQPADADCVSSGLVMKKYLEHLGKTVTFMFPRELTRDNVDFLSYLPYFEEFTAGDTRDVIEKGDFDTLVLLDGTNWEQFYDYKNETLPKPPLDKTKKIIQIDHHLGNPEDLATFQIKNSKASSTIEIILMEVVPEDFIDAKLATLAYAGLVGDTGNFKWNFNTNTMKVASLLLDKGAETQEILDKMFFSKSREFLEQEAYAIQKTEYDEELHAQFLYLSIEIKKADGISEDKVDTLKNAYQSDISRSVPGYFIGFVINENPKRGTIHIGARGSNLNNKVSLPKMFAKMGGNGGGHFNAAGMDCVGNFDEIVKQLKATLRASLKEVSEKEVSGHV